MRALLLPIGLLSIIGVATSMACTVGISLPTGAVSVAAYGTCSGDVYAPLVGVDFGEYCPGLSCSDYYALCEDGAWGGCDCDIPSGYALVSGDPDFGGGPGGGDGGSGEAGSGEAGSGDGGSAESGSGEAGSGEAGSGEAASEDAESGATEDATEAGSGSSEDASGET